MYFIFVLIDLKVQNLHSTSVLALGEISFTLRLWFLGKCPQLAFGWLDDPQIRSGNCGEV
jgi:hypothetical protein